MKIEGVRRIVETSSFDTANEYLRFGWKLIDEHTVAATLDRPAGMNYVLASVRTLADTRRLIDLGNTDEANRYLALGWRLIDQFITADANADRRNDTLHLVLAWQSEDPAALPNDESLGENLTEDELTADDEILPEDSQ